MPLPPLLKPELYREDGSLLGGSCACGHVFFPYQSYGCECCGEATQLRQKVLAGAGTLVSSSLVHTHQGASRHAPFIVGAIRLIDGPIIRTLLDHAKADEPLVPGLHLKAVLREVENAEGEPYRDLRFTVETKPA